MLKAVQLVKDGARSICLSLDPTSVFSLFTLVSYMFAQCLYKFPFMKLQKLSTKLKGKGILSTLRLETQQGLDISCKPEYKPGRDVLVTEKEVQGLGIAVYSLFISDVHGVLLNCSLYSMSNNGLQNIARLLKPALTFLRDLAPAYLCSSVITTSFATLLSEKTG